MKRVFFLSFLIAAFMLAACNLPFTVVWNATTEAPASPPLESAVPVVVVTATPEGISPATATSAPTISGTELNLGGVYMILPPCLASNASAVIEPESNPGADMPYYAFWPEHRKITLTGYPLSDKQLDPEIRVYPVAAFDALIGGGVISDIASQLNALLSASTPASDEHHPYLPFTGAANVFVAQSSIINFQNGSGTGYLTEMAQFYDPANNNDMFYTFQGLTTGGTYWVSITLPVNAPFLPETYDGPVPAGGIPSPDISDPEATWSTYKTNIVTLLNTTPADTFTPSLVCIMSFIQTLDIGD
jgi:hypothetical protein